MDINSLLSPQDTPTGETPPPLAPTSSPQRSPNTLQRPGRPSKRSSSNLSHQLHPSPHTPTEQLLTPTLSHNGSYTLPHLPMPSPGITSAPNGRGQQSATSTPSSDRASQPPLLRAPSTPGMDTLADLASMQHQQQASRAMHSSKQRNTPVSLSNLPRSLSVTSVKDITMAESPKIPKVFMTKSLSAEECRTLSQLAQSLVDKPFDYTWNVQFIELLRSGYCKHIDAGHHPQSYELLSELRQARNGMDSRYSLGEQMWSEWIHDEKLAIVNTEDRIKVMELFGRAIVEEPSSVLLWRSYGDFMYDLWASANGMEGSESWNEEDRTIGKEIFTFQSMMEVWEQAVSATQWRINDSNIVWDRWIEIMEQDQSMQPSPSKIANLEAAFTTRLLRPHETWDRTSELYSRFVSTYHNSDYENIMEATTKQAGHTKRQYAVRETLEFKILSAYQKGDRDAEWFAFQTYLDWERRHQGVFSFNLINGLYERATLRFHNDSSLWEDYVEFLIQNPSTDVSLLSVVERATRHCPWAGSLWSHRILTLEAEQQNFTTIETVKHRATETGMLEQAGMEELLKVYIAWCGYLRRKAFQNMDATEDDIDIAEVGIRSALEHVKEIGEKQLGKAYQGDPSYRLERIHIKFLMQCGNSAGAREIWFALEKNQGNSFDFWYRYYIWEMVLWSRSPASQGNTVPAIPPEEATSVLRKALKWIDTVDWPEQLITMFTSHCEQHESVQVLRLAIIEARKANTQLAKRREREQAEAAATMQQQQAQFPQQITPPDEVPTEPLGKRKREAESVELDPSTKRTKSETSPTAPETSADVPMTDSTESTKAAKTKRDRENASVTIKNLPADATQTKVRQFFRGCGTVLSISLQAEDEGQVAVVEFESPEDANYALTRSAQSFDGNEVQIFMASGTTLFVANYPPHADEAYLRNTFAKYGEIASVRFPSLKYNTHRRFCYVQFMSRDQAEAALSMNGQSIEDHELVVKISDPSKKKDREGASYEGREVFVRNVHWKAQEEDIKTRFVQFGTVVSVRIPRKVDGNSKGVAYVVFEDQEQAQAAIKGLDGQQLTSRTLHLEISQPYGKVKRSQTTIFNHSASPEPDHAKQKTSVEYGHYKERTIALLNIPDTVNDARVRAIAEPYGTLVKIKLMHHHQGALVEFQNKADAAKASLGLDGHEIAPGRLLHIGTVEELKRTKEEIKSSKLTDKSASKKAGAPHSTSGPPAALKMSSGFVSRPGLAGSSRRGGRGGLGFRKTVVGAGKTTTTSSDGPDAKGTDAAASKPSESTKGKSNADFKALISGNSA